MKSPLDVLIVGAGPSGLTMAIECARYGLSFRIIDELSHPSSLSKAIAIQARTLETFEIMGLLPKFLELGKKLHAVNFYSKQKKRARVDLSFISSPFPFALSLEQNKTEEILTNSLKEKSFFVERGVKLFSYEEKDGVIWAETNQGRVETTYLVGSDGPHSIVRKTMGCSFQGKTFRDIFSLADVKLEWGKKEDELHIFLESKGVMAIFPLPEKQHYRLVFQLKRLRSLLQKGNLEHGIIESKKWPLPTLLEMEKQLTFYTKEKVKISNLRWAAHFSINSRLSSSYQKGSVFLVGDAAHIHSPVGGQGMNTGIQDAFNLAWKIAYAHKKILPNSLLDSYEKERRHLGKVLLKATEGASTLATIHSPLLLFLRNHLLSLLLSFKQVQKKLVSAISELNISSPHKRAANYLLLKKGKTIPFFTLSENSTDFHLLLFNIEEAPFVHPHVKVHHVKTTSLPKAILVRPDGYIAVEETPPFQEILHFFPNSRLH